MESIFFALCCWREHKYKVSCLYCLLEAATFESKLENLSPAGLDKKVLLCTVYTPFMDIYRQTIYVRACICTTYIYINVCVAVRAIFRNISLIQNRVIARGETIFVSFTEIGYCPAGTQRQFSLGMMAFGVLTDWRV